MGVQLDYPTQHSAPPVNGSRPSRLDSSRLPDPEPAGVGKAHWVGDTSLHKPPKERTGEREKERERERERERDTRHEPAIQFMVCSAQDVPPKDGGVLAICWGVFFGPFFDRMCTFYP